MSGIECQLFGIECQKLDVCLNIFVFILFFFTVVFAWNNLKQLRLQNKEIIKEKRIANNSRFLEQVCLGILKQSGDLETKNKKGKEKKYNHIKWGDSAYHRIKDIGFYDGVRCFLGRMAKFPNENYKTLEEEKEIRECYNTAPNRFGIKWHFLFDKFQETCDLMEVPSGLEDYLSKEIKDKPCFLSRILCAKKTNKIN